MYKDTKEALQRLEAALLAEDAEDTENTDTVEQQQIRPAVHVPKPRSVYNNDRTDTDLEEYSETVRKGRRTLWFYLLIALALLAIAGVFAVLAWMIVKLRGMGL